MHWHIKEVVDGDCNLHIVGPRFGPSRSRGQQMLPVTSRCGRGNSSRYVNEKQEIVRYFGDEFFSRTK